MTAYPMKIEWYALARVQPRLSWRNSMILPAASLPIDRPHVDIVTYQASTSDRLVGVVSWEMMDLSVQVSLPVKSSEWVWVSILFDGSKWSKITACRADNSCKSLAYWLAMTNKTERKIGLSTYQQSLQVAVSRNSRNKRIRDPIRS